MALELDDFTASGSNKNNVCEPPILLSQDASSQSQTSSSLKESNVQTPHAIEKYEDHDDAGHIATWRDRLHKLVPLTSLASIVAYGVYFTFRIICTVDTQRVAQTVYPVAWIFIAIELGVTCESRFPERETYTIAMLLTQMYYST